VNTSEIDRLQLRLLLVDEIQITPGDGKDYWRVDNVQYPYWRLIVVWQEGMVLQTAGKTIPLQVGQFYLIPSGVPYSAWTARPVEQTSIHFEIPGHFPIVTRELFADVLCLDASPGLTEIIGRIARHRLIGYPVDIVMEAEVKAVLYALMAGYLREIQPEKMETFFRSRSSIEPLTPAIKYIDGHLSENLPNKELANICCMSEGHFIRRFKEVMGKTPVQFVTERRIWQAARLLYYTERSVTKIAEDTGFGSRPYFHRAFSRMIGLSPNAYRKAPRTRGARARIYQSEFWWYIENDTIQVRFAPTTGYIEIIDSGGARIWQQQASVPHPSFTHAMRHHPNNGVEFQTTFLDVTGAVIHAFVEISLSAQPKTVTFSISLADPSISIEGFDFFEPWTPPEPDSNASLVIRSQNQIRTYSTLEPHDEDTEREYRSLSPEAVSWIGVLDHDNSHSYNVIIDTPDHAEFECMKFGSHRAPRIHWKPCAGKLGYPRSVTYAFQPCGGIDAMHEAFKAHDGIRKAR